jgi:hypothetical protein
MSSLAKENQPSLLRATSCSLPSLFQQVNHSPQKHEVLAKGDAFSSRDRDSRHLGADSTAKILLCEYGIRGYRAFSFHWKDLLIHSAHLMLVEHIFFIA